MPKLYLNVSVGFSSQVFSKPGITRRSWEVLNPYPYRVRYFSLTLGPFDVSIDNERY